MSSSYTAAVTVVQSLDSNTDKDALFAAIDELSYGAGSINPAAAIRKMTEMFAEGIIVQETYNIVYCISNVYIT